MLQIFANNFVSFYSFHLNDYQRGGEYSDFTYHPFTSEENFSFAQGIYEMLIRGNNGYIEIFLPFLLNGKMFLSVIGEPKALFSLLL
jgi:hypothetical protein